MTDFLEIDIETKEADKTKFILADHNTYEVIRLVNNAFTYTIHDAMISTSSGTMNLSDPFQLV